MSSSSAARRFISRRCCTACSTARPPTRTLRRRLDSEAAERLGRARLCTPGWRPSIPSAAGRLHPNDVRRVVRALEVWELTGRPISAWQTQWAGVDRAASAIGADPNSLRSTVPCCLCLDPPRAELYARIDARVAQMIAAGWSRRCARLRRLPRPLSREAAQAVGYKELFDYLDGRASLDDTVARIQTRSRQLRQAAADVVPPPAGVPTGRPRN